MDAMRSMPSMASLSHLPLKLVMVIAEAILDVTGASVFATSG
jgi:hypothetical protein